jgi:hypothetical protein
VTPTVIFFAGQVKKTEQFPLTKEAKGAVKTTLLVIAIFASIFSHSYSTFLCPLGQVRTNRKFSIYVTFPKDAKAVIAIFSVTVIFVSIFFRPK